MYAVLPSLHLGGFLVYKQILDPMLFLCRGNSPAGKRKRESDHSPPVKKRAKPASTKPVVGKRGHQSSSSSSSDDSSDDDDGNKKAASAVKSTATAKGPAAKRAKPASSSEMEDSGSVPVVMLMALLCYLSMDLKF